MLLQTIADSTEVPCAMSKEDIVMYPLHELSLENKVNRHMYSTD